MKFKRISAAALALAMVASLSAAALAAGIPEGWTPADGARLISANPYAGNYETVITINGEALEFYEYTKEDPETWETETVTVYLNEIAAVPEGYVPMRAVAQADHGYAYWYKEENMSTFTMGDYYIVVSFLDMSVTVDDELVEGASALLIKGVTYLPVSVIDGLEGFEVVDNSADGVESYEIKTPNGAPIMKLAYQLMETADMGIGQKTTAEDFELVYGEVYGFSADYVTESVLYMPMMINPDTLMLGKVAEGQTEALEAALEAFRAAQEETFSWYLSQNLPKVQDARFATEGDWFLFLIGENADEVVEQFRAGVQAIDAETAS